MTETELEMRAEVPVPTDANPFALGWRWRDGGATVLPLTAADLLWQEEGDQLVTNDYHNDDVRYLCEVLRWRVEGKAGVRVLTDHCINFQVPTLGILGPDVILLNGAPREWDGARGTFPVRDMDARPLYCFEVTSPGTRQRDLRERLDQFFRAGVPGYVVIDAPYGGGRVPQGVVAFQAGPTGYERLPAEPNGRVWIEVAEVWLSLDGGRLVCHTPDGARVPSAVAALRDHMAEVAAREAAERERDAEKAAREAAEQRLRELEAELAKLRGANTN